MSNICLFNQWIYKWFKCVIVCIYQGFSITFIDHKMLLIFNIPISKQSFQNNKILLLKESKYSSPIPKISTTFNTEQTGYETGKLPYIAFYVIYGTWLKICINMWSVNRWLCQYQIIMVLAVTQKQITTNVMGNTIQYCFYPGTQLPSDTGHITSPQDMKSLCTTLYCIQFTKTKLDHP